MIKKIDFGEAFKLAKLVNPMFDEDAFRLAFLQDKETLTPGELVEVRFLLEKKANS